MVRQILQVYFTATYKLELYKVQNLTASVSHNISSASTFEMMSEEGKNDPSHEYLLSLHESSQFLIVIRTRLSKKLHSRLLAISVHLERWCLEWYAVCKSVHQCHLIL